MPALVLFGRRWLIASDDVPLPAAGLAVFHFVSRQGQLLTLPVPHIGPAGRRSALATLFHAPYCLYWAGAVRSIPLALPNLASPMSHLQVWCILLIIWFVSVHGPAECEGAWRYDVGVGGLLAAFVLSLGLEMGMVSERHVAGPLKRMG